MLANPRKRSHVDTRFPRPAQNFETVLSTIRAPESQAAKRARSEESEEVTALQDWRFRTILRWWLWFTEWTRFCTILPWWLCCTEWTRFRTALPWSLAMGWRTRSVRWVSIGVVWLCVHLLVLSDVVFCTPQDDEVVIPAMVRARSAATLVVAAVTLLPQWETELKRHAPSLKVLAYHGPSRARVKLEELLSADVVLTSYQMLRSIVNVTDCVEWHRVVFDGNAPGTTVVGDGEGRMRERRGRARLTCG